MRGCYSAGVRFFYVPNCIAAMKLLLRRTLVSLVLYAALCILSFLQVVLCAG